MRKLPVILAMATLVVGTGLVRAPAPTAAQGSGLTAQQAHDLGVDAYVFGYPLVTMELTRRVMTNVAAPDEAAGRAPMGQFSNKRTYPDASYRDVTAPNADTLYSVAWLDVGAEPYILHVPDENDRYYLMPMLDGWTEVFAVPGKRTTGTGAGDFAITGPGWTGSLPSGIKEEYKSATSLVWILGRTYSTGTPEDFAAVHALQDQYAVVPLSAYGRPYTPPGGTVDPAIDMQTPVRDQVDALDAAAYFNLLATLLKTNPPVDADAPMMARLAQIGLVPGRDFDPTVAQGLLGDVPKDAQAKIEGHLPQSGVDLNGWTWASPTGLYGTDYLQRATITWFGLGANRPQDAIYPTATVDGSGQKLNGANRYVLHFDADKTPPVDGFWSLTMYDEQYFFVANPLNRYSVGNRSLTPNPDGSLDVYIQNASPGADKEGNWLPAPSGEFVLMLRMYWPRPEVIDRQWDPPGVSKAS